MKYFKFIAFVYFFLFLSLGWEKLSFSEEFSDILVGIPLMEGLVEDVDQRLVFDKEEGRIVEMVIYGNVSPGAAINFYQNTLPELGWVKTNSSNSNMALTYQKEGETLELRLTSLQNSIQINFILQPIIN